MGLRRRRAGGATGPAAGERQAGRCEEFSVYVKFFLTGKGDRYKQFRRYEMPL